LRVIVLLLVGLVAVVSGCGSADLDGKVTVVGSTTLLPMMSGIAGTFSAEHPLVRMNVRMAGTSDGVGLFCDGLAAITGASRPLNAQEQANCKASHVRYVRLHVANDGVVLFTADDKNLPTCLTSSQIYSLMGPESVGVAAWSEASTVIKGAGSDLPDSPITVLGPDAGAGTRQVLIDLMIGPLAKERGMVPTLRSDYTAIPSELLIPSATSSATGGLGFTGMAVMAQSDQKVLPVAIDSGDGCVKPTAAHVRDGSYALGRPLFLYVNLDAVTNEPTLRAFVDQVLQPSGLSTAASTGGIALDKREGDATRDHWQTALDAQQGDSA
jgi:phosphate transport system substrate-binding protein